ncbi:HAD-IIIC family phosphatase [Stakelama tenebrarum]|uniref:HAD-IIIC family phosphatase n=1 Tax=Stakelama tenebrarum TaxID=2711215 RepID=A0A6G6Y3N8_9SPHN|nr:HAD-IIIC family phosphatase [Sphingosinithalassobacter tenebrarum]QIG79509.1 HAD-IIIC family phosphatase [Sphingosinithalassobacter tenebrarum]
MKETHWEPFRPASVDSIPAEFAAKLDAFSASVSARSHIIWGEHCSECSFPVCQTTCAFYTPRADLVCRRFEQGIEEGKTPGGSAFRRIRFRKWGKLEGTGPAAVFSPRAGDRFERGDRVVGGLLRRLPIPFRSLRHWMRRWNKLKAMMLARPGGHVARHFVVEAWSLKPERVPMTITFLERDGGGMYQHAFEVGPEYSHIAVDVRDIARTVDLAEPYLVQIEPVGEAEGRDIVFGTIDFVDGLGSPGDLAAPQQAPAGYAKVIVWDLDNSLWEGTLAEDGVEGLRLRPGIRDVIVALDKRGILHSIASKNDPEPALAALEHFGLRDYFLYPQISWNPKSDAVAAIAAGLDLGVDSFIFVDDQPFERGEVAQAHPALTTLTEIEALDLLDHPMCAVPATAESARRRALYQAEAERGAVLQRSGGQYHDFLRSCGIVLTIEALGPDNAERVYELSQRTNQLNFRGTRYSRDDVAALAEGKKGMCGMVLHCSDRFGDYGIIGFAAFDPENACLHDFFMSCRVQRKYVEHAFFDRLKAIVRGGGRDRLTVLHRPTERNGAVTRMLDDLGFARIDGAADSVEGQCFAVSSSTPIGEAELVSVKLESHLEERWRRAGSLSAQETS